MKKYLLSFLVLITLLVFPAFVVSADVTSNPRITDDANLFTEKESKQITKQLDEISNLYDIDMVVITTNNSLGDGSFADFDASMEHFHDNNKYAHNSVFCGINMDPANREVIIQAYGHCQKYIPDDIAQSITDDMVDDLKDARYADAVDTYIENVTYRLDILLEKYERQLPKIEKGNYLIDDANLLTVEEEKTYYERLKLANEKHETELYAITLDEFDDDDLCDYIDRIVTENGLNDKVGILAIFMGDSQREVVMCAYGKETTRYYLNDRRCQDITDKISHYLSCADYTTALNIYIDEAEDAITHKQLPVPLKVMGIELLISMIIGGIYVAILIYRSSAHSTATRHTYQEPGSAQILARTDSYTHTTVTRTKIESSSSSSSSGRSRVGGGGHSHGGSHHSSGRSKF